MRRLDARGRVMTQIGQEYGTQQLDGHVPLWVSGRQGRGRNGKDSGPWLRSNYPGPAWFQPAVRSAMILANSRDRVSGRRSAPRMYDLRSTFISWLAACGVDERLVQRQVGHAVDREVTRIYTTVSDTHWSDLLFVQARDSRPVGVADALAKLWDGLWCQVPHPTTLYGVHDPRKGGKAS